jgi:D-alanyl-D-alanine carboxypeptidase
MKKFVASLALLAFAVTAKAQTAPQVISDSLMSILQNALPTSLANSGVIMEVYVPGQWTWTGAVGSSISGMTAQQPQANANVTDRFRVGSITKMMVAVCILKLEEAGMLSIEDPISLYLRPTLVNDTIAASDTVRIRHLLNHTSGIANSADNTSCQQNVLTNPLGSHSLEEAVYCGASQGEMFPPEFAWGYSNTNYSILAMIIESVTGQSYSSYVTQNVFTPLGLTNTEIPTTNQITGPHMGCYWNIGNWIDLTIINPTTYTGWADVVSSTHDLNLFHYALRNGQLLNSTSWGEMQTMYPGTFGYGLGYDFYTITSQNYTGHYGEVANTSGCFFGDIQSGIAPNGYYISYNYNTQGANMQNDIDVPVLLLLNSALGLEENNNASTAHFNVYPNPVSQHLTILNSDYADIRYVEITDMAGKTVTAESGFGNQSQFQLDLSALPAGAYMLSIETAEGEFHQSVFKQ